MFICDLSRIRIMGILQRVAVCFFITASVELSTGRATVRVPLVPPYSDARAHIAVFRRSRWHWLGCALLCCVWAIIMWGVDVAPAFGETCGRGVWTPACNAQRVVDASILGVDHMYFPSNGGDDAGRGMTFQRLPACSSCSPGLCTAPADATNRSVWCEHAPFDPEGLVSSLTATAGTFIGAHAGFVILVLSQDRRRLAHWLGLGALMVAISLPLHFSGVHPMNTDLYTFSFLLFTSGMGMLVLALFYWIELRCSGGSRSDGCGAYFLAPAIWVGRNAITMYVLAESGIVNWVFGIIYLYSDTDYSLANVLWPTGVFWGDAGSLDIRSPAVSHNPAVLVWTLAYIVAWTMVARYMDKNKIYIKL
jgi:predicted acyltransferase